MLTTFYNSTFHYCTVHLCILYFYHDFVTFQHHPSRHWYTLKDKKLLGRSKGAIQLEIDFIYNHVRLVVVVGCFTMY